MHLKQAIKHRVKAYRNPVYLLYAIGGLALFLFFSLIAESGVGPLEIAIFRLFNNLPNGLYIPMLFASLFGSLLAVPIVAAIAVARRHYANSLKVFFAGITAYLLALYFKSWNIRPRPEQLLDNVNVREASDAALGYPSGHMAVAAVLALTSYIYLPKKYHRIITILVLLVGVSRMYLGVHFPLDLIGGWGIGLFVGGLFNFAFGSRRYSPVPPLTVKHSLKKLGFEVRSVKIAAVDARGSIPYIAEGKPNLFVKIVGIENNIADWLFKLFRRVVYRRLEDEHPYMSPKRQLEHEAYVAMLALQAGVKTPRIETIFEADHGRWALAQQMIAGKSLDRVDPKRLNKKVLEKIWREVKKMHEGRVVHRDLRAANIFLDDKNQPWIIDFGFSEGSVSPDKYYRDTVELIASLSLLVDYKTNIAIAAKVVGKKELQKCMPYLDYAVLSGATTKAMKKRKALLVQIRRELSKVTGAKHLTMAKVKRLNVKTLLLVLAAGLAINILTPQLASLDQSVDVAKDANYIYLVLALLLSGLTYILAGFAYRVLTIYPVSLWPTIIVQLASSFASKAAPAGTGGMALNGRYLYKNNHSSLQAGAVITANTTLGLVGHISVVFVVAAFTKTSIAQLVPEVHIPAFVVVCAVLLAITMAISVKVFPAANKIFVKGRDKLFEQMAFYRDNYWKLILGYLISVAETLTYATILYICALALGVNLNLFDVVYVFTVGAIAATVTPTPGGIGGAEAAFVASLVSLGVEGSVALAITMLYRLLTFWLPILPGFAAFRYATNRDMV